MVVKGLLAALGVMALAACQDATGPSGSGAIVTAQVPAQAAAPQSHKATLPCPVISGSGARTVYDTSSGCIEP